MQPSESLHNRLLNALPAESKARLRPHLVHMEYPRGKMLYEAGARMEAVYFPEVGILSMVANMADGTQTEVGLVGCEGMLGVPLVAGIETSYVESMVQVPGHGWRMSAAAFREACDTDAALRKMLLRYSDAMQSQVMQTAACNGRHDLEQRLCRWLLMCHDRVADNQIAITQEYMAMMLGVHRPSITVTAGILQRAGLIRRANGRIEIVDRPSLEAASCECYASVQNRFQAVLGVPKG